MVALLPKNSRSGSKTQRRGVNGGKNLVKHKMVVFARSLHWSTPVLDTARRRDAHPPDLHPPVEVPKME
jgi:hypothetical protein